MLDKNGFIHHFERIADWSFVFFIVDFGPAIYFYKKIFNHKTVHSFTIDFFPSLHCFDVPQAIDLIAT